MSAICRWIRRHLVAMDPDPQFGMLDCMHRAADGVLTEDGQWLLTEEIR